MAKERESRSPDNAEERKDGAADQLATLKPALEDSQSLWQLFFLTRMWTYIQQRRQRHLNEHDVRALPNGCDSVAVAHRLDQVFKKSHSRWALARSLWTVSWRRLLPFVASDLCGSTALIFTPLLTKVIVNHIADRQAGLDPRLASAVLAAVALPVIFLFATFTGQCQYAGSNKYATAARGGLVYQVIARTAQITEGARLSWTDGRVLSLISGDGARVITGLMYLGRGLIALVGVVSACASIIAILGAPALAGIAVVVAGLGAQLAIARYMNAARTRATTLADLRMRLTHEFINGLTAIKLQGWEHAIADRIQAVRQQEISALRPRKIYAAFDAILGNAVPVMALTVAFAAAQSDGTRPSGATLFSSFLLFRFLVDPLTLFAQSFGATLDGLHAAARFTAFLRLPIHVDHVRPIDDEKLAIDAVGRFRWPVGDDEDAAKTPFLLELDLKIPRGELVAVIGPVASGKTALCRTLLDGLDCATGHLRLPPKVIGTDQQTYIVSGATLRDQITFSLPFDETLYRSVMHATALDQDAQSFQNGDQTQLGERGLTVSGGQASRIGLARALYAAQSRHADILVLDDPLSALDSRIGQHVFDRAIAPLAGKMTCIVATHALHFAHRCDRILFLGEPGRVTEQGSFEELIEAGGGFSDLIRDHTSSDQRIVDQPQALTTGSAPSEATEDILRADYVNQAGTSWSSTSTKLVKRLTAQAYVDFARISQAPVTLCLIAVGFLAYVASTVVNSLVLLWWAHDSFHIGLYAGTSMALTLAKVILTIAIAFFTLAGSRRIHRWALGRVVRTTASWLTVTPLGRTMALFGADIGQLDAELDAIVALAHLLAGLIVLGSVDPWPLLTLVVVLPPCACLTHRYQPAYFDVRAIDLLCRSRMVASINETLRGLSTHESYGTLHIALSRLAHDIDFAGAAAVIPHTLAAWIRMWLNCAMGLIIGVVSISSIIRRDTIDPNEVGLALASVLVLVYTTGNMTREYTRMDSDLNCAQRLIDTAEIDQEPQDGAEAPSDWPGRGEVIFSDVDMRYRAELPLVLRGVSFTARAGEKVAIVGRTGAGKSSLLHALFRMTELAGGRITIDGIDVAELKLLDLRKRLCVLPQTTMILKGSIRDNLDPFHEHDDATLYDALRRARFLEEGQTLDFEIESDGRNISQGQRALLSLARALVQRSKILVLDEASAHVDMVTDAQLQSTLTTEFKDCTVIAIAHRLRTIIGYDKVIVMQDGQVAESGSPAELFERGEVFKAMCQASDISPDEIDRAQA